MPRRLPRPLRRPTHTAKLTAYTDFRTLPRLLVESAWHARRRPKVGYELARRQRGQDAVVVERTWRCQQRLYQRWQRMAGRGKPQQKIVVACARELAGFVWAIATEQPLRNT